MPLVFTPGAGAKRRPKTDRLRNIVFESLSFTHIECLKDKVSLF